MITEHLNSCNHIILLLISDKEHSFTSSFNLILAFKMMLNIHKQSLISRTFPEL